MGSDPIVHAGSLSPTSTSTARGARLRPPAGGGSGGFIENSFKTQKCGDGDGFGLEHTFCRDEHASRAAHMLMQLAHNLWQVFESGIVRNLSKGVSRPTQSMWARKLCEALHHCDFSGMETVTVYLNHGYERAIPVE